MKRHGKYDILWRMHSSVGVLEVIADTSIYETSKGLFVYDMDRKRRYVVKELKPPQTLNGFFVKYEADFT